jgi:hypothetical protein
MGGNKSFPVNNTCLGRIRFHTRKMLVMILLGPCERRKSKKAFQTPPQWVINVRGTGSQTMESR